MATNITYLLGAGASANCLPIIDELPTRMREFQLLLSKRTILVQRPNYNQEEYLLFHAYRPIAKMLIDEIDWVMKEVSAHKTIDTLAKKYYLTDRVDELKRLKRVLIVYFLFEQTCKTSFIRQSEVDNKPIKTYKELPDKRYDSFIASIIEKGESNLELPATFNIITWNYDMQFELAFREYLTSFSYEQMQLNIQAIPNSDFLNEDYSLDYNKFSLIRLNGVAGFSAILNNTFHQFYPYNDEMEKELLTALIEYYKGLFDIDIKAFIFSWEKRERDNYFHKNKNKMLEYAKKIMSKTDILVVIGYSFPLFNRRVDKELIFELPNRLKCVYIQDTGERANEVRNLVIDSFDRFKNYPEQQKKSDIIAVDYTNQFFIPPQANI